MIDDKTWLIIEFIVFAILLLAVDWKVALFFAVVAGIFHWRFKD